MYLFGKYTKPYMKEIDHPALIQEWKLNLETAAYLKELKKSRLLLKRKK